MSQQDPSKVGLYTADDNVAARTVVTCTRRLQFCAGHRVMGHENKCGHLHGHNYVVHLTAMTAPPAFGGCGRLDSVGRVIDFSVLKYSIEPWIQTHWDHGFILNRYDTAAISLLTDFPASDGSPQKVHTLPYNPTAENIARHLLLVIGPALLEGKGVVLQSVVVEETENCRAEASL